jgi:hypothetical protein
MQSILRGLQRPLRTHLLPGNAHAGRRQQLALLPTLPIAPHQPAPDPRGGQPNPRVLGESATVRGTHSLSGLSPVGADSELFGGIRILGGFVGVDWGLPSVVVSTVVPDLRPQ